MKTKLRKSNGEGHLTQRKNGLFQVNVQKDGVNRSFYGKSEKEALEKLHRFQVDSDLGIWMTTVSVSGYIERWMIQCKKDRVRPTTYDRMEGTYKRYIKKEIGNRRMSKLTSAQCQDVINKWSGKYSYSTVKKIYELLKACFTYAVNVGDLARNPMAVVTLPRELSFKKPTKQITIPTDEEFSKIMAAGETQIGEGNHTYYKPYIYAFRFIAATGLRIGELLALTWDKVSIEERTAKIDCSLTEIVNRDENDNNKHLMKIIGEPKSRSGYRTIRLNKNAIQALLDIQQEYMSRFGNPMPAEGVIVNTKGNQPSIHDLERTLASLCKRAGVEGVTPHVLRHYFASKCLENGAEMLVLSKHLGHARPSITMNIYAHVTEKQDEAFCRCIESI